MRSLLGRFHRPFARSADEQLLLMNNLGDGSTLSLDFTTMGSTLDPRLTFTRSTNATFINSSGLVEWAAVNMFINSAWTDANNLPTGWTLGTATGAISRSGETRTFTCTAAQYWFYQQPATKSGLTYTLSFEITALSGTFNLADVLLAGSSTSSPNPLGWYKDGAFIAGGGSTQATTGRFALVFTANADNTICRIGLGSAGTNVTGSVTIRYAQIQPGIYPSREYLANTSTSAANTNTPRFDHDPTTLAPRGLLIEGSANNLAFYSEYINPNAAPWNVYWFVAGAGASVTPVSQADPAGNTTASRCILGTSTSGRVYNGISTTAGVTYTLSFWARSVSGTTSLAFWHFNSASGNSTAVTINTSWQRYQVTILGRTGGGFVECGIANTTANAATVDLWGLQFETGTGTGASSYIPTGASTGSRAYDHCYATGANFTSWFSVGAGTMVVVSDNIKNNTQNLGATISDDSTSNYVRMGFKVAGAANEYLLTTVGGPSSFQGTADSGYAPSLNTVYRMAYAWDTNNFGIVANGGAVGTDSSGTLAGAGVLTRLVVGGDFVAVPNDIYFKNGHIKTLKYWPTRLPNAQLQALTT